MQFGYQPHSLLPFTFTLCYAFPFIFLRSFKEE